MVRIIVIGKVAPPQPLEAGSGPVDRRAARKWRDGRTPPFACVAIHGSAPNPSAGRKDPASGSGESRSMVRPSTLRDDDRVHLRPPPPHGPMSPRGRHGMNMSTESTGPIFP